MCVCVYIYICVCVYIYLCVYICVCVCAAGFNPVWEETLSFTLHMADIAMVRFLVWDHDPIGRDFVGQRTIAFSSLMPGLLLCGVCVCVCVCEKRAGL